jgi:hypothetical protein
VGLATLSYFFAFPFLMLLLRGRFDADVRAPGAAGNAKPGVDSPPAAPNPGVAAAPHVLPMPGGAEAGLGLIERPGALVPAACR